VPPQLAEVADRFVISRVVKTGITSFLQLVRNNKIIVAKNRLQQTIFFIAKFIS
jgi:hypothetical protein